MNVCEIVDRQADTRPEQVALLTSDRRITYSELRRSICRLANALIQLGVGPGDRVALSVGNTPEFVVGYYAAMRIGAVAVPLNPSATAHETNHHFAESKPKVVICGADRVGMMRPLVDSACYIEELISVEAQEGSISYEEIQGDFSDSCRMVDRGRTDPAAVILTAGLLGRTLGATLSHGGLNENSTMLRDQCGGGPEQRSLAMIPLYHAFGATVNLLAVHQVGGTVCLVDRMEFPDLVRWLNDIRVTFAGVVPMVCTGFLNHPACQSLDLSSLQYAISGGTALSERVFSQFQERFGIALRQGYGLTEASPVVSWNDPSHPNRPSTVGLPLPGVVIEIRNDNHVPLPSGCIGEVVVRGPSIMTGYLGRPTETRSVIRDGWLYTGDLGYVDEEGYLTLTGLKKDLIVTAGFNVYPLEVEEIIRRHSDVQDAALDGVPDDTRGTRIEVRIVLKPGCTPSKQDIHHHCRQYLSSYKCPKRIHWVDKIDRKVRE